MQCFFRSKRETRELRLAIWSQGIKTNIIRSDSHTLVLCRINHWLSFKVEILIILFYLLVESCITHAISNNTLGIFLMCIYLDFMKLDPQASIKNIFLKNLFFFEGSWKFSKTCVVLLMGKSRSVFSTFLMLWPLNRVPCLVMAPKHKIISVATL